MTNEFKIEVPITLKGGNEGNRVGIQIGDKIAAQLNKSLKAIGIGQQGKEIGLPGSMGISRGLKAIGVAIAAVGAGITLMVGLLAKASPYLKGILDIFGRSFMMFFRPFGDFLGTLLRPMALLMMKMAVAFMKFARTPEGKAVVGTVIVVGGLIAAAAIGTLASQALAIAGIGAAAGTATPLVTTFLNQLRIVAGLGLITVGIALAYNVLKSDKFGGEELLKTLGAGIAMGVGASLLGASAATGLTIGIITVTAILGWKYLTNKANQSKAQRNFAESQGINIEEVIQAGAGGYQGTIYPGMPTPNNRNESVMISPVINFNGNISSAMDIDSVISESNRMTEMQLKQRGIS